MINTWAGQSKLSGMYPDLLRVVATGDRVYNVYIINYLAFFRWYFMWPSSMVSNVIDGVEWDGFDNQIALQVNFWMIFSVLKIKCLELINLIRILDGNHKIWLSCLFKRWIILAVLQLCPTSTGKPYVAKILKTPIILKYQNCNITHTALKITSHITYL